LASASASVIVSPAIARSKTTLSKSTMTVATSSAITHWVRVRPDTYGQNLEWLDGSQDSVMS
jgi:hypothetical protein